MVPQKIILEGFLCYRTRQEIDLSDLRLCMLAGPNGSGKSAVFDAITFALFGIHRGGSQNVEDLINKKSDLACVTFEFLLDGHSWQIYRTAQRNGRTTRCVKQLTAAEAPTWQLVPETSSAAGFKDWIESKLPLSGKAFMSSMLLRQGESDRLLSADPRDRFDVLAGIMELERFQELERTANDRRRTAEDESRRTTAQLAGIPTVTDTQCARADQDAADAVAQLQSADDSIASLQERLAQSRQWADLKSRLDQALHKRQAAAQLLAHAPQIEADHQSLTAVSAALPHLSEVLDQQQQITGSQNRLDTLSTQRGLKAGLLDAATTESKAAQEKCSQLEPLIPQLETHVAALARKIADSRRVLDAADATQRQRESLEKLQAQIAKITKKYPHADSELARARQESQRLNALAAALPTLERFCDWRRTGTEAAAQRQQAETQKQTTQVEIEAATSELQSARQELEAAQTANIDAQNHEAESHAFLQRASEALAELDKADGKPDCPTCGQPLTESHLAQEHRRRESEAHLWNNRKTAATKARQESEARVKQLARTCENLDKHLRELAQAIQRSSTAHDQAAKEIARATSECNKAYTALAEDLRARINPPTGHDWASTTWPSTEELADLELEAKRCAASDDRVKDLGQLCSELRTLTARATDLREVLASHPVAVPGDLLTLRKEHATFESQQKDAEKRLSDSRESLRREQHSLKQSAARIRELESDLAKLDRDRDIERSKQANSQAAIRRATCQLSGDWPDRVAHLTPDSLEHWKAQADDLERRGAREAFNRLNEARTSLAAIDQRIAELQTDIAAIPEPARQEPDFVAAQLDHAKSDRAHRETSRHQAESRRAELQASRARRHELEQFQLQSDRNLRHFKLLCELLGKKRLQLYLVRQTERKVVECANRILERLSAGDLYLQLRDIASDGDSDASEAALDLLAIHRSTAGGQPVAVAFLSGSQRFRVAVSLALAIGQVAGNHRCGECVIIDEGFGSLDSAGQDVMIHELRQLQGIMKRIILVSHQESFAQAFPHGYRFNIQDGQTRVERMSA
jgi:DNA repair exonuclease SbcCD ATPase subunit